MAKIERILLEGPNVPFRQTRPPINCLETSLIFIRVPEMCSEGVCDVKKNGGKRQDGFGDQLMND